MSSAAPYRVVVHLSIIFGCVLVCEGRLLDLGLHKREGDDVYEKRNSFHQERELIEFPELNEMTSGERAENRQLARKVATILEEGIHMMANDVLQMWAITRSDGGEAEAADDVDEAEAEMEAGAEGAEKHEAKDAADPTEGVGPDNTEGMRNDKTERDGSSLALSERVGGSQETLEGEKRDLANQEGVSGTLVTQEAVENVPEKLKNLGNVPATLSTKTYSFKKTPALNAGILEETAKETDAASKNMVVQKV